MSKQEIALQLTLKILETSSNIKLKGNAFDNPELLEKNAKLQARLTSTIFNDLVNQLNCD